jgi:hypothetical protein
MNQTQEKAVFIVLSQSGTWMAKLLRRITHTEYNHSSLAFEEDLSNMYSFGRRYKYYPFWGGFIRETPTTGVFSRFPDTRVVVLKILISETKYEELKQRITEMYQQKERYHYNYIGCFLNWFHKGFTRKKHLYCSEFIKEIFVRCGVFDESIFPKVVRPYDFKEIFSDNEIYCGKLKDYDQRN